MNTASCHYSSKDRMAFAYGEMQKHDQDAFSAHLDACGSCRESVAELRRAADLCHTLSSATVPEPEWTADLDPDRVGPRRLWWQQPFVWVPLAAICGFLLWLLAGRFPEPSPSAAIPENITGPVRSSAIAVAALPIKIVDIGGHVYLKRSDSVASVPVDVRSEIFAGDSIISAENSWLEMELDDGSRLRLGPKSSLRLETAGPDADRFHLDRGAVSCRVRPRSDRPFVVGSKQADTRVVGTLFAVRQMNAQRLTVGVASGRVELDRSLHSKPVLPVYAGHQMTLSFNGEQLRSDKLGRGMRKLMSPLLPRQGKPDGKSDDQRVSHAIPSGTPESPSRPQSIARPEAQDSKTGQGKNDSVATLVDGVYRDTRWIFDQLREEMEKGHYERVLNRLNNYIADPEAPERSEAVFLKAECLEKMNHTHQAHQAYREYQIRWPAGAHAKEALLGQIRTRAPR
jgi:ferric-dicitrate binding protein FerR (iron transport regulator)